MHSLGIVLLALFWWVSGAQAACSGSGMTWSCTAGTTSGELSTALSSASDGATLTFAAGNYSWSSWVSFSNSKGATLICANAGACHVTVSNTVLGMNGNCGGDNTKFYRISGFDFAGGGGGNSVMWFHAYNTGGCTLHNLRIDHNTFTGQADGTILLYFGDVDTSAYFYGLIDHNTATNANGIALVHLIGGGSTSGVPSGTRGTVNNMFIEDNTITSTRQTNTGLTTVDSWGGQSIVFRYNTVTNGRFAAHGVTHSWGPVNLEVYGNTIIQTAGSQLQDGYRSIHHQGSGELLVFNNIVTAFSGKSEDALQILHYRSFTGGIPGARCNGSVGIDGNRTPPTTYYGYPCFRQPGRDVNRVLQPMYVWNNRWSDTGTKIDLACADQSETNPNTCVHHVVANRDYYNAVSANAQTSQTSPFNGTTGMGFGTLANRPTTCTTGPEALDAGRGGVGYFATDVGGQGTLYRCSATNTWTVHYTPYTYPHPLVGGGGTVTQLSPPTNLRVLQ